MPKCSRRRCRRQPSKSLLPRLLVAAWSLVECHVANGHRLRHSPAVADGQMTTSEGESASAATANLWMHLLREGADNEKKKKRKKRKKKKKRNRNNGNLPEPPTSSSDPTPSSGRDTAWLESHNTRRKEWCASARVQCQVSFAFH